jgi:hypothetical protein
VESQPFLYADRDVGVSMGTGIGPTREWHVCLCIAGKMIHNKMGEERGIQYFWPDSVNDIRYGACVRETKTYIFIPSLRLVLYQFLHTVSSCHHRTIHYTQQTATNTGTMVAEPLAPPATRI